MKLKKAFLAPVDNAWLRMEDPTNLMMITGVFLFQEPLEMDRLKVVIEQRLLSYRRFRQRVVQSNFQPSYWEDDPNFDLDAHIHRVALPSPGDQEALQNLINDLMSTPLDFSKPLWHAHLVENYGEGCALIMRLHHCIADGIALMRVLLNFTDETADEAPLVVEEAEGGQSPPTQEKSALTLPGPVKAAVNTTQKLAGAIVHEGMETLLNPSRAVDAAKLGADSTTTLGRLLLLSPDPKTPFKGPLGVRKVCAWSQPISLPDVKAIGKVTSGTVNDVLLTAVSGALGRYLHTRGEPAGGLDFRAVVPVNLRPLDEEPKLGNAFGLVFLSLPVGIADPLDRLFELKKRMDGIKGTPEAIVSFGILAGIGVSTSQIQDIVVKIFGMKATAVMTNVPGPREVRYLAGKPIDGLMFWVPQSGKLGLGVSIMSYNNEVLLGIATDAGLVPDPETIVNGFHEEFEAMMGLVAAAREMDTETT
ncbi:MAG: wax ester/triacylglycerol synthase family O-acyltransferase [Candidatus Promineifilaceae bacterium]